MTISQPRVELLDTTLASTSEFPTQWYYPHPSARNTKFLIVSDQALTVDVDEQDMDGTAREIEAARAVVANTPLRLVYAFGLAPVRLRITPSAQPAVVHIEASYDGVSWM